MISIEFQSDYELYSKNHSKKIIKKLDFVSIIFSIFFGFFRFFSNFFDVFRFFSCFFDFFDFFGLFF